MIGQEFVQLSLTPILVGILASLACALPGNFLLLRRQTLIGDAISHVVLPGIVAAFLISGSIAAWPMMLGASGAALFAVLMIEAIKRFGRIESGAAMGVVFTSMFAGGVLLLEQSDTSSVHLDVQHALYGNLESLIWLSADGWGSLFDPAALSEMPPQVGRLIVVLALVVAFIAIFWLPLKIATFDESFALSIGIPARLLGFALVALTAIGAVAAFDAVGSIIVIAMFICPAATARLMTDDLFVQVLLSALFAVLSAVLGYVLAGYLPALLGYDYAVSAAGMMATVSGLVLGVACLFGPKRTRVAPTA